MPARVVGGHPCCSSLRFASCRVSLSVPPRGGLLRRAVTPSRPPPAVHSSAAFHAVEKPPSGPQWLHEIKLDGYRMAARIDNGRVQLLTRTGLDWTEKYPSAIAALANLNIKTAYLDGELCDVDEAARQSSRRSAATTGPACSQPIASERSAVSQYALRISARSFSRALGRAGACRRDHLFDLNGRQPPSAHDLRRPA
jgi:ATP dependent DNA ligase domain